MQTGRASFRQEEIKRQMTEAKTQINLLKLTLSFAHTARQTHTIEATLDQLEKAEYLHEELAKKLRSLELNQIRQRKRRERKRITGGVINSEHPSSSGGDQDEVHSPCSSNSSPLKLPQETGFNLPNPQIAQDPRAFCSTAESFSVSSSSSSLFLRRTLASSQIDSFQNLISGTEAQNPVQAQANPSSCKQVEQVCKDHQMIEQIAKLSESDFLNLLHTHIKNGFSELSIQLIESRQTFLRDSCLFGRENAGSFLYLFTEHGILLSEEQKQFLFQTNTIQNQ
jgi:hypothetical protein